MSGRPGASRAARSSPISSGSNGSSPAGGLRLILVSADFASQRPDVEAFLGRQGVVFPSFVKAQGDQEFIEGLDRRWSGSLPASLLFDRRGKRIAFGGGLDVMPSFSRK